MSDQPSASLVPSPGLLFSSYDYETNKSGTISHTGLLNPSEWSLSISIDRDDLTYEYKDGYIYIEGDPLIYVRIGSSITIGWEDNVTGIFPMRWIKYLYSDKYEDRLNELPSNIKITQPQLYGISSDYYIVKRWDEVPTNSQIIEAVAPSNPIMNIYLLVSISGYIESSSGSDSGGTTLVPVTLSGEYYIRIIHTYDGDGEKLRSLSRHSLYQLRDINDWMDKPTIL